MLRKPSSARMFSFLSLALALIIATPAHAWDDPTRGKPFLPWLWENQFQPTIENGANKGNLSILAAGAVTSVIARQYEWDVYTSNLKGDHLIMTPDTAGVLGTIGGGGLGIGIVLAQLWLDTDNGLMHGRAIVLTTLSHVTLSYMFQKSRPGGRGDFLPFPSSFPSGHAASAFATATSLAYAYGYKAGIPAIMVATAISAARVSENAHWLSDVFAGAALGVFWARASYQATAAEQGDLAWMPLPYEDGAILQITKSF
ncbi:hypothetical protein BH10BDE1_BH10BDE1_09540 [soil metagenome]